MTCHCCGTKTENYIAVLRGDYKQTTQPYYYFCMDCYTDGKADAWTANEVANRQAPHRQKTPRPKKPSVDADAWDAAIEDAKPSKGDWP